MKNFKGRVAAITGAGSGIGRALAVELARRGARLAICDVDTHGLAETEALVKRAGAEVKADHLDVSQRELVLAYADEGVAHWGSVVHYLTYTFNPKVAGILRVETFDDFDGQRTGFEGLYTAVTVGAQIRPTKGTLIRPELRYDYNGYSTPFEGKHGIFTAAFDFIVRY